MRSTLLYDFCLTVNNQCYSRISLWGCNIRTHENYLILSFFLLSLVELRSYLCLWLHEGDIWLSSPSFFFFPSFGKLYCTNKVWFDNVIWQCFVLCNLVGTSYGNKEKLRGMKLLYSDSFWQSSDWSLRKDCPQKIILCVIFAYWRMR